MEIKVLHNTDLNLNEERTIPVKSNLTDLLLSIK
jgi:hypothetical protein